MVDPDARRGGVGRALLDQARRVAVDSGHVPMLDAVDTPAAAGAIALYRREGWEEVGRVKFTLVDPHVDELVFRGPPS
jgi:GNAT superfamily N-acetyltransferase